MNPYANLRGNSPIVGYEIEATRITVWFKGGKLYSYSYNKAGKEKPSIIGTRQRADFHTIYPISR